MASFQLSRLAEADLLEIGSFTLQTWGTSQAVRYLDELENACERLADNAALGRRCDHIRPGLRRMEQGRHVIFYRAHKDGIVISRVLHERMLPQRYTMKDSD